MIPLLDNDNACKNEIKLKVEKQQMKRPKIMCQNRKDESLTRDLQKTNKNLAREERKSK